jgi:adenosine 3'-phospho 5'-phosphosulfate transporter B3
MPFVKPNPFFFFILSFFSFFFFFFILCPLLCMGPPPPPPPTPPTQTPPPLVLLGVDLSDRSRTVQFLLCCAGVFFFYLGYGYVQEAIFRTPGFRSGWYLTAFQFLVYAVLSRVALWRSGAAPSATPTRVYLALSAMTVGTMGLSNASLGSLNYPTSVIFKSSKVVPVMLAGVLVQGRRYPAVDYLGAALIVAGLVAFNLADVSVRPEFPLRGTAAMLAALCFDAMIGNYQERWMREYGMSTTEMVNRCYSWGFLLAASISAATGDLSAAVADVHPAYTARLHLLMLLFAVLGYFGVDFVLALIRHFGAVVAVTVTSCRKAATIIVSFLIFPKPFVAGYAWGGALALAGIMLNVARKNPEALRSVAAAALPLDNLCCGALGALLAAAPRAAKSAPLEV